MQRAVSTRRYFMAIALAILAVAVAVPEIPVVKPLLGIEEAHAQQRKRKTLFDVLFKRRSSNRTKRTNTRNRRPAIGLPGVSLFQRRNARDQDRRSLREQRRTAPPAETAPAKPTVVVVKNENAGKILVVGDFMASALAKGLERQYADNSNVVVIDRGRANSGLVRDDVIDWPSVVPQLIAEEKPIAVLVLAGMNDRQQMRLASGRVAKLSDGWMKAYRDRITKIAVSGAQSSTPVLWVGLPPVKSGAMNADYLVFNEMYRNITETAGGVFIDVWDGFTNAEGKFVSAGPDINGQIVRLRTAKGINMTRAGQRKLGFFADKVLRKLGIISDGEEFNYAALGTINPGAAQPGVPEYDPAGSGKTVVISLASPSLDGGSILEGEADFLASEGSEASVSHDLVSNGRLLTPKPGRIDAGWGVPSAVSSEKTEEQAETRPETVAN